MEINSIYNPEIRNGEAGYGFSIFTLRVMTLWLCGSLYKQPTPDFLNEHG